MSHPDHPGSSAQTKSRPSASCIPCRTRKVKCSRTTPCTTCLSRNHPDECVYTASDVDRAAMRQADLIAQLRGRVRNLRGVLGGIDAAGPGLGPGTGTVSGSVSGPGPDGAMGNEDAVYRALREGPPDTVGLVVAMLRGGGSVEDIARVVREKQSIKL